MSNRGRPRHPDILTPREWEVLALLREGLSNDEIGQRLGITLAGAKYHVSEILSKLGVTSREEAARWEPSERPWWAGAIAPIAFLWRKANVSWLPTVLAGIVGVAVLVGFGLLVWGLVRTNGEAEESLTASATVAAFGMVCPESPTLPSNDLPLFTYAAPDDTIWAVSADGTSATPLICDSTGSRNVSWSPSGTYLAYVDGGGSLRLLNVETGEDTLVDNGSEGALLWGSGAAQGTSFRWSPTADMLLYQKFGGADLRTNLGNWVVSPGSSPVALKLNSSAFGLTWNADGLRLVYYVFTEKEPPYYGRSGEIYLVDADGAGEQKLVDGIPLGWSPDGRLLAYWTEDRGGSSFVGDIVIMEVETGRSVSLGEFTSDESPAWSPDTTRDVFHNMLIDMETQTATSLFERPAVILGWSPDGTKVAYVEGTAFGRGPRSLMVLDTTNQQRTELHTSDAYTPHALGSGYRGAWSPDGRYFSYSAVESPEDLPDVAMLYVTDTGPGDTKRIWEGSLADSVSTAYSPDGGKLLVEIDVDRSSSLWVANADGSALTKVVEGEALRSSTRRPAWRPNEP